MKQNTAKLTAARTIAAAMALGIGFSMAPAAFAQYGALQEPDALEEVATEDKLIQIRPAVDERPDRLTLSFRADKSSYRVDETIRFTARGNKAFYLYLFNIDPATGKGVAILPNRYQTGSRIKYTGGTNHAVPNANLEFYSDRPGVERILVVASERYLDVDRLLKRANSKSVGDFFVLDLPLDGLDEAIDDGFGTKGIRVRERNSRLPTGLVIKEMNLRITR